VRSRKGEETRRRGGREGATCGSGPRSAPPDFRATPRWMARRLWWVDSAGPYGFTTGTGTVLVLVVPSPRRP
jgi:hypothetical protein